MKVCPPSPWRRVNEYNFKFQAVASWRACKGTVGSVGEVDQRVGGCHIWAHDRRIRTLLTSSFQTRRES